MGIRGSVARSPGSGVGGSTAPTTTSSGSGGTLAGVYDITASPYNATTAATDNTAAIQAAINAAKASGGKVYVPPGVFKYASPLICDLPSKGFSIEGASSGAGELATVPSELRYTGTASPAISCHSVYGFGLVGLRFTYDNAGFTGDVIDMDGGPHAADCTNWLIEKCSSRHVNTITARSIIRMSQTINGEIRDCGLAGATNCIRFADPGGAYVVGVEVNNCTFNNSGDAHILMGCGAGENNRVVFCRFEAGNNTTAIRGTTVAVDGGVGDNAQYSFEVRDCWFGDSGAPTTWIKNVISQSNQYPCVISGNRFASSQNGTHLTIKGRWKVEDNSFEGGTVYDCIGGDLLNLVAFDNYYNTPTALFNATRFPAGYPQNSYVSLGNSGAEDVFDGRVGIKATSGTFGTFGPAAGDLVIGARSNAGFETGDAKAKVYFGKPPSLTRPMLALQAPTDGTDGFISLITGGASPLEGLRVGTGPALGFNGTFPITKPTVTGSRAGNAALASLLTALANYGLIVDSSTA
jgi:hypothetical protein